MNSSRVGDNQDTENDNNALGNYVEPKPAYRDKFKGIFKKLKTVNILNESEQKKKK